MKNYIVYNSDGKILRTGMCTDDSLEIQAQENEFVIEGEADDETQRIKNGKVVNISKSELNKQEVERFLRRPNLLIRRCTEDTVDQVLKEALGKKASQFKKDNYSLFRKQFYPEYIEFIDANVKLTSEDESIRNEGSKQLEDYYKRCLEVKTKFPKGG
ncbi:MAG: hypothetical protein SVK08_02825 [Halobacteriota archaeon]|nr:hypothetical protein [Halobacteriota archaeon]